MGSVRDLQVEEPGTNAYGEYLAMRDLLRLVGVAFGGLSALGLVAALLGYARGLAAIALRWVCPGVPPNPTATN